MISVSIRLLPPPWSPPTQPPDIIAFDSCGYYNLGSGFPKAKALRAFMASQSVLLSSSYFFGFWLLGISLTYFQFHLCFLIRVIIFNPSFLGVLQQERF